MNIQERRRELDGVEEEKVGMEERERHPLLLEGGDRLTTLGTIETNINREDLADQTKRADMTRRIPIGRLGEPDDIAQPVVFFASDMAKYCTGASLLVDGGAAISLQ